VGERWQYESGVREVVEIVIT